MSVLATKALWCPRCRGHLIGETLDDGWNTVEALRCIACGYRAVRRPDDGVRIARSRKKCRVCGLLFWPTSNHQFQCKACRQGHLTGGTPPCLTS